jgi:3-oxoadipate enol-lactonase
MSAMTSALSMSYRAMADGTFAMLESSVPDGAPLVLLLHSMGTSKRMYEHVIPQLPHLHCVAVDVLGHGESTRPRYEYTISDHARSIAGLVADLRQGDEPVLVAGCSLGAVIAVELAVTEPEMVDGLLLNGCPGYHLESQRTSRLRTLSTKLLGHDGLPLPEAEMPGAAVPASPDEHEARQADVARCGRWLLSTQWAVAAYDIAARFSEVRATTNVLMGDQDFWLPTADVIVAGIAGARLETVEGAGHLTPYDDPSAFANAVRRLEKRTLLRLGRTARDASF